MTLKELIRVIRVIHVIHVIHVESFSFPAAVGTALENSP